MDKIAYLYMRHHPLNDRQRGIVYKHLMHLSDRLDLYFGYSNVHYCGPGYYSECFDFVFSFYRALSGRYYVETATSSARQLVYFYYVFKNGVSGRYSLINGLTTCNAEGGSGKLRYYQLYLYYNIKQKEDEHLQCDISSAQ